MDIITTILIINLAISNIIPDVIDELEIEILDWKPINCSKCLGFWVGLLSTPLIGISTALFIASASYMINKIINKY